MSKMLSVKDTAKETGLSEHAVRQYVKKGIFKHIRVGESSKAKILLEIDQVWETLRQMQDTSVPTPIISSKCTNLNMFKFYEPSKRVGSWARS